MLCSCAAKSLMLFSSDRPTRCAALTPDTRLGQSKPKIAWPTTTPTDTAASCLRSPSLPRPRALGSCGRRPSGVLRRCAHRRATAKHPPAPRTPAVRSSALRWPEPFLRQVSAWRAVLRCALYARPHHTATAQQMCSSITRARTLQQHTQMSSSTTPACARRLALTRESVSDALRMRGGEDR